MRVSDEVMVSAEVRVSDEVRVSAEVRVSSEVRVSTDIQVTVKKPLSLLCWILNLAVLCMLHVLKLNPEFTASKANSFHVGVELFFFHAEWIPFSFLKDMLRT